MLIIKRDLKCEVLLVRRCLL